MLEPLLESAGFAFDVETTSESGKKKDNLHFLKNQIITVSFANDDFQIAVPASVILEEFDTFKSLMTDPHIKKVGHNAKFDTKCIFSTFGVTVDRIWMDTYVASKLIDETIEHGLKSLSKRYLNFEWGEYNEDYTMEEMLEYNKQDSVATWRLAKLFADLLTTHRFWDRKSKTGLYEVEMEVYNKFIAAEINGVPVDEDYLEYLLVRYTEKVDKLGDMIAYKIGLTRMQNINAIKDPAEWLYYLYTRKKGVHETLYNLGRINLNSSAQLGQVLFEDFGFDIIERSDKTGAPSTGINTMTTLSRRGCRFVDWIMAYKKWEMLKRHISKLITEQVDGRIYPTFNTVGTDTGRFTCQEPNLQQIPSKGTPSLKIRGAFRPKDHSKKLIVADYSNVELRLLAHFTKDINLIGVYSEGGCDDLHTDVENKLRVTRKNAKGINFGISYGMGPKKLSFDLDISYPEAQSYIEEWNKAYPRVEIWKKNTIEFCKKFGFTQSIAGRRRHVDLSDAGIEEEAKKVIKYMPMGLYKAKLYVRSKREREAINFVIQGSSADITKYAIGLLLDQNILMQVHDEIVIYEPTTTAERVAEVMQSVGGIFHTAVPLTVESKLVDTWREGK